MKLGAHQSMTAGYIYALERIKNIGGNCLQIFSSSPRAWNPNTVQIDDVQIVQFKNKKNKLKINPIYFHASYLVNLANEEKIGHLSKLALISELNLASKLDISGCIVHLGSFKKSVAKNIPTSSDSIKMVSLITHLQEVLDKTPINTLLIVENAGINKIGKDLNEIAEIIQQVNDPRVKVCLDTCHLHSAGYDLTSLQKLDSFLLFFDKIIGLDRLEALHLNDSKDPFNSGRDRHENIGKGTLGVETFKLLLNHPKVRDLPFIIETPGFDDNGPDKQNLDILKSLIL